uniref:Peptidase S1 domain-containing protein n=1 Tax=Romanomermis culicivorax TaxID=13658 RepID=A0A915HJ47_ROMCU
MKVSRLNCVTTVEGIVDHCTSYGYRAKRVISSDPATPHSRPWTTFLKYRGSFWCGASLVNRPPNHHSDVAEGSSDILLTAAHCVIREAIDSTKNSYSQHPQDFSVVFNKHNSTGYEDAKVEIEVANTIVHREYLHTLSSVVNDITMVRLKRPVNFSETIKPIALSHFPIQEMNNCSCAGWGRYTGIPGNEHEPMPIQSFNFVIVREIPTTPINWDVSIAIKVGEGYHCLGMLNSNDYEAYDEVNVSANCYFELRKIYNTEGAIVMAIINDTIHTSSLNISDITSKPEFDSVTLQLSSPIPLVVPNAVGFGHLNISEFPFWNRLNPYIGGYKVDSGARPSIVYILGDLQMARKCYGVLINESYFSRIHGHKEDTRYVLTTVNCIRM